MEDFVAGHPELAEAARWLADLIERASLARARAVRVEPVGAEHVVRFNLDGVFRNTDSMPAELGQALLRCAARFPGGKGGAGAAGGPMTALLRGEEKVEVAARAIKGSKGPVLVLSFPDWTRKLYKGGLSALGMHPSMAEKLAQATRNPGSAVIISGPPGSGRTSTLHAALSQIDIYTTNIITLERKIEHELEQVVRHEVDMESAETFQKALADVLREEPHVIAVDELTTARQGAPLFAYAAGGGRLLAAMQVEDSGQAVQRLLLGGDAELVSKALICVLNQRLLRKLCEHCKEPTEPNRRLLGKLEIDPRRPGTWFKPVGCERCMNVGYWGRTAIFEFLLVNDVVRKVISGGNPSAEAIRRAAGKEGLRSLFSDGVLKVRQGITTIEEVQRVLR
jgi:type II secretory ATPase GspE/PulE/Tfp pilus assembly ATPase PilB-like protein